MNRIRTAGLYFFLLLTLAAQSCRKDPEAEPKLCALASFAVNSDTTETFDYNEAGQLVKHTQEGFVNRLEYDGAGQLVRVRVFNLNPNAPHQEREITLAYADGGKTVTILQLMLFFPTPYEYTAELDEKGQLTRYTSLEANTRITRRYEYNEAGDLIRGYQAGTMPEYLLFVQENFDGKYNPYSTSASLRNYQQLVRGKPIGRHNALLVKHYGPDGSLSTTQTTVNTYNDRGYVADQQGKLESLAYSLQYTYRCP